MPADLVEHHDAIEETTVCAPRQAWAVAVQTAPRGQANQADRAAPVLAAAVQAASESLGKVTQEERAHRKLAAAVAAQGQSVATLQAVQAATAAQALTYQLSSQADHCLNQAVEAGEATVQLAVAGHPSAAQGQHQERVDRQEQTPVAVAADHGLEPAGRVAAALST